MNKLCYNEEQEKKEEGIRFVGTSSLIIDGQ